MLPQFFKFVIVHKAVATITFGVGTGELNLKLTTWTIDPATGLLVYTQDDDDDFGFTTGTFAAAAELQSSEVNNATALKNIGAHVQIEVTMNSVATAVGTFDLYISGGDETGKLETDANGYQDAETSKLSIIGSLTIPTGLTDNDLMRSWVFNI